VDEEDGVTGIDDEDASGPGPAVVIDEVVVTVGGSNGFGNVEDVAGDCPDLSQGFGGATIPWMQRTVEGKFA